MIDVVIAATEKPMVEVVVTHLASIESVNQIIIVDSNIDRPSIEKNFDEPKLKTHYLIGQKYFNKSFSINLGAHVCESEWLIFCDADVLISEEFINKVIVISQLVLDKTIITPNYVIEQESGDTRPAPGICAISKDNFLSLGGYCSDYKGWGMEDRDFLHRAEKYGLSKLEFSNGMHISHSDEQRVHCYDRSLSLSEMRQNNKDLFQKRISKNVHYGTFNNDINSVELVSGYWQRKI